MSLVLFVHAIFPDWERFNHRLKPFSVSLSEAVLLREQQEVTPSAFAPSSSENSEGPTA
jgi:hypothetical protein